MTQAVRGAWIGLAGVGTFLLGAAIATSVGVWGLGGSELLDGVSQASVPWRLGNALLAVGSATSAVGMLLVSAESATPLARAGTALWIVAGASGLVGFAIQGEGTLRAAAVWTDTGTIPTWVRLIARAGGIAIGIFMACGIMGSVALGWHMRDSRGLSTELLTSGAIVLVVALVFAVMTIPAAVVFLAAWVSVARLMSGT